LKQWAHAFAVEERTADGFRRSLQFFDACGDAVHKVHLIDASDVAAFKALVARFRAQDQSDEVEVSVLPIPEAERPDEQIDGDALLAAWDALRDVHDFHGLLKTYGVSRTQALRLAGHERARPVSTLAHADVLTAASASGLPIMVFVGNRGCVQIHRGPVYSVKRIEGWFNVLDPEFNLHLVEAGVARSYVVRKPTVDGVVTSLELYDAEGNSIATFFGDRHAGHAENTEWRALAESLATLELTS
jgi:putative hemin transport protein